MSIGVSTIERWLYQARHESDPVHALRTKRRTDAGATRELSAALKVEIQRQYRLHPSWSYQLHHDNLAVCVQEKPELGPMPSYNTIRRYMKTNGLCKRRVIKQRQTAGAMKAQERLEARLAWIEQEYHQTQHSEIGDTPLNRYIKSPDVGRKCPDATALKQAFCTQVTRTLRKSDGTLSIAGRRFEVSSYYRHLEKLTVRYARWDLSFALLVDPHTNSCLERLYPQDKSENASGLRRKLVLKEEHQTQLEPVAPEGIAPLLKKLMADFAATGLPPAYLPQQEKS
jgi:hypothetical protein